METTISKYFNSKIDLKNLNYKVNLYTRLGQSRNEIDVINQEILAKKKEIDLIDICLNEPNNQADRLRIYLMTVLESFSNQFRIAKEIGIYPALNQGLILPAYIFWIIWGDLKHTLACEGKFWPSTRLMASPSKWDTEGLEILLNSLIIELSNTKFEKLRVAIDFFDKATERFNEEYELIYSAIDHYR